jgi:hypothetical protein
MTAPTTGNDEAGEPDDESVPGHLACESFHQIFRPDGSG